MMGKIRKAVIAAAVILAPQFAMAADMLPPPPPLDPPPLRGSVMPEFSGWYLRGDVGVGANKTGEWSLLGPTAPTPGTTLQESIRNTSVADSALWSVGVGYAVNNWFRFDLTGEYRGSIVGKGTYFGLQNSLTQPCGLLTTTGNCVLYQNNFPGNISAAALMLNGYVDLGTWYSITPYVGAGVGISRNTTKGFTDTGLNVNGTGLNQLGLPVVNANPTLGGPTGTVAISSIRERSTYSVAWALMAGLAYDVTPGLKLEMGYRYMNFGTAKTGLIDCLCAQIYDGFKVPSLSSHDFRVGMRWMLGDPGAPPPMMQAPLVRKY